MEPQNFKKDDLVFYHLCGRSIKGEYLPGCEAQAIQEKYLQGCSDFWMQKVLSKKWVFKLLPFVKEVAVCNTVAFGTADETSDIDLFFILNSNRFFTGRFFISLIFEIFGLRRKASKVKGRFCLSFFVAEDQLDFSDILIENDVYFYYWFKSLIFLKGDKQIQSDLIKSNFYDVKSFRNEMIFSTFIGVRFFEKFVPDFVEQFLEKHQLKRAKLKNEKLGNPFGVMIKNGMLKFHVKDIRFEFRDAYLSLLLR